MVVLITMRTFPRESLGQEDSKAWMARWMEVFDRGVGTKDLDIGNRRNQSGEKDFGPQKWLGEESLDPEKIAGKNSRDPS